MGRRGALNRLFLHSHRIRKNPAVEREIRTVRRRGKSTELTKNPPTVRVKTARWAGAEKFGILKWYGGTASRTNLPGSALAYHRPNAELGGDPSEKERRLTCQYDTGERTAQPVNERPLVVCFMADGR